jgi:serine/threonine protein kinase
MAAKESVAPLRTLGEYELLLKVGEGSMGTVYKARHRQTQQLVAIKIMAATVARNPTLLKRFEQEFRVASKLDHPNIVRVMEYNDQGESPYLVMEFVEGESLADKLDREGQMPEDEAVHIVSQVCHGLHWAHCQGLIHRDIKPDNIMVTADGVAKIMDLGLAKEMDAAGSLTRTGGGLGTPNYFCCVSHDRRLNRRGAKRLRRRQ